MFDKRKEKELRKLNEKIGQLRASGDLEQAQELERQRAASEAEVTEYLEQKEREKREKEQARLEDALAKQRERELKQEAQLEQDKEYVMRIKKERKKKE